MLGSSTGWIQASNRMVKEREMSVGRGEISFPGGGTMFPNGVGEYVDMMQELIPEMKDGTVRAAIDTSCGSVEYRLFLVSYLHEILPFPSNSFDMAHCSRCLIPWTEFVTLQWGIFSCAFRWYLSHGNALYSSSGGFCAFRWILGIYLMQACLPILFTIWLKVTMLCNVN
ncbi:hypothetical protein ACSQ67_011501 [Phaseolus vulgaris]